MKNAIFYAYHGVFEDEQNLGGKFEFDVDMYCDSPLPRRAIRLQRPLTMRRCMPSFTTVLHKKFYLIEALANTIVEGLLREFSAFRK